MRGANLFGDVAARGIRFAALCGVLLSVAVQEVRASGGGMTTEYYNAYYAATYGSGYSSSSPTNSCARTGCHTNPVSNPYAVTTSVGGATSVALNSTTAFTLYMTRSGGGYAVNGGFNLAATGGTLNVTDAGTQKQLISTPPDVYSSELTHNAGRSTGGTGSTSWGFSWTAPNTSGYYYFNFCVNPVNGDLSNDSADADYDPDGDGYPACSWYSRWVLVNDTPAGGSDAYSVLGNSGANNFFVLNNDNANASNSNGDTKTVDCIWDGSTCTTGTVTQAFGTLSRSSNSANNYIIFTPATNYLGTPTAWYKLRDSFGVLSGWVSISITVNNDAPTAVNDAVNVNEDSADNLINVLANDTDPTPSDTKRIIAINATDVSASTAAVAVTNGNARINSTATGNQILFTPAVNFAGATNFTYTMRDTIGNTSIGTVTVTVTNVNDAPVAVGDSFSVINNPGARVLNVLANDTDVDSGDTQTVTQVNGQPLPLTLSSGATVALSGTGANNTINYTPAANFTGIETFTYTMRDTAGAAASASVTVRVVGMPADKAVDATGYLTPVDLGAPATSGSGITLTTINTGPFRPGRHFIDWSGSFNGVSVGVLGTQTLDVRPLAEFAVDQTVTEGATATVTVTLNGTAPQYPVTVPYTVGGTADGADSNVASGTLNIGAGTQGTITFNVLADGVVEGPESILFTMGTPTNAAPGTRRTHSTTIAETNVAPRVVLTFAQGGSTGPTAYQDQGLVTVNAVVSDPNPGDTHSYSWTLPAGLPPVTTASFSADPTLLTAGLYDIGVQVADSQGATAQATAAITLIATSPALGVGDSDLDGVADNVEGAGDTDGDGLPDHLDALTNAPVLPNQTGAPANALLLETEGGLRLRLGRIALAAGHHTPLVSADDIATYGGTAAAAGDGDFSDVTGYYDFEIHGVAPGGRARLVIPLPHALPPNASWRLYSTNGGWRAFTSNSVDGLATARAVKGVCPGPSSDAYVAGLNAYDDCLRLALSDGGPNDTDGTADGVIRDPGGAAVTVNDSWPSVAEPAGETGGRGALSPLALFGLIAMAYAFRPRPRGRRHD